MTNLCYSWGTLRDTANNETFVDETAPANLTSLDSENDRIRKTESRRCAFGSAERSVTPGRHLNPFEF
jgi:hypothetical protein